MTEDEKNIASVINIAQTLLRAEKDKAKVTSTLIEEKVKLAASVVSPQDPSAIDQQAATSILIQRFSHWIGKIATLKDVTGHIDWLVAARNRGICSGMQLELPPASLTAADFYETRS